MGSQAYTPDGNAGFVKLSGNKYMAPIAGIAPTQPQDDQVGRLGIPDTIVNRLEHEGYLMERARVAKLEEETLGQYTGKPASIEVVDELDYGAIVPDYAATADTRSKVYGRDGAYMVQEQEEEPDTVCITFANDDTPTSYEAVGFKKIAERDGVALLKDILDDQ